MIGRILGLLLCLPSLLLSTELKPWLSKFAEIQSRATYLYQTYPLLASTERNKHYSSHDYFATLSLAVSPYAGLGPLGPWWTGLPIEIELEATCSDTHRHHWCFDNIRLTGRYRWLDDISGEDPVTLTTGLTLTQAWTLALKDPSSFHHGRTEAEAHVSIGKEISFMEYWVSRGWGVLGIGIAERGSPWIRLDADWEHNFWECHYFRVFAHTLWGLGSHHLRAPPAFDGYGDVNHQSIDLGLRYTFVLDVWGDLILEYSYRVYSRNFPKAANLYLVSYHYPFGI